MALCCWLAGGDGLFMPCTSHTLSQDARTFLENRVPKEEEAVAAAAAAGAGFYSEHLKRRAYDESEIEGRKARRTDRKEAARLAAIHQQPADQQHS